jgi:2-phospho-L-lactate guanylyltransferase
VLVVTNEPAVAALAETLGAIVEPDRAEAGQSAAAGVGIAYALQAGIERVLLVPGDCPALDATSWRPCSPTHGDGRVVVDRPGPPWHGHQRAAADPARRDRAGVRARTASSATASWPTRPALVARRARPSTLLLDIDTPEDLAALLATASERAPRTRAAYAAP